MLTYHLESGDGPLYQQLYDRIREDIESGRLKSGDKMPSRRALAENLGVSTVTVENSYARLIDEGYLYTESRKGYFVSDLENLQLLRVLPRVPARTGEDVRPGNAERDGTGPGGMDGDNLRSRTGSGAMDEEASSQADHNIVIPGKKPDVWFDFSSNRTDVADFPFSIWAKLMRETISTKERELLEVSPCCGVRALREAIAGHLASFRGMSVDPDQIIVGAGTEYLYTLLVRLLGQDKVYCIENPGYRKLLFIYRSNQAVCRFADVDGQGMIVDQLRKAEADVAHISPTHHFPTGITMPVSRRYELLAWAGEKPGRFIIEDDYDSEFRIKGRPIPSLQSIDAGGKVVYMNTFSKSLTSTFRISYMVLPEALACEFYRKLGFYSCTVSTFDQYALAAFISRGYFEKHINRMRLHYGRKRAKVLEIMRQVLEPEGCRILENNSGLHMILELCTDLPDQTIKDRLMEHSIRISSIADYDMRNETADRHQFIISYSGMDTEKLEKACRILREEL